MRLGEYLSWASDQPWGWGTNPGLDCCKFAGKWAIARGLIDPMVLVWRNPYDSERSALRRIAEAGGLVPLWTAGMAHVGADQIHAPIPGAIGIIQRETVCGLNEASGIWTGQRWVTLGLRGFDFGPAEPLAMWRV